MGVRHKVDPVSGGDLVDEVRDIIPEALLDPNWSRDPNTAL